MDLALIESSLQDRRRRSYIASGICTGFLLLLIAGADCWPLGSDPQCPPGPEPQCPINPDIDHLNYFSHPTDCHYYIQCDGNRKPICRPCTNTPKFIPYITNCVWPLDAACEHNDETSAEKQDPPICVPDRCTPAGMKMRDYTDCTRYFICINETHENRRECPTGQHFNAEINECDNQCTAGCTDPCDIPECDCPRKEICVNISDTNTCKKYFNNCTNTWRQCEGELNFNKITGSCAHPCRVYIPGCDCPTLVAPDQTKCHLNTDNCTNTWRQCEGELKFNPATGECADPCQDYIPGFPCRCNDTNPRIVSCRNCAICEVCRNGQTFEDICPTNLRNECPENKCCVLSRDKTDCQMYYNGCSQIWSRCPANLHFNEVTQSCDHPCTAGCKDPRDITECCHTEGEVFEDPCSCDMFYSCTNGIKELVKCEDGLQYNSALRHCDRSCSCECPKLFARNPECCASTGGKPEPQCPATTYPIYLPHPSNGQYFYTCLNGVRTCSRCPLQHRWNIDMDTCDKTS